MITSKYVVDNYLTGELVLLYKHIVIKIFMLCSSNFHQKGRNVVHNQFIW